MYRRFPTPNAWQKHTQGAMQRGLSAGALACLGTQPQAEAGPEQLHGLHGPGGLPQQGRGGVRRRAGGASDRQRPGRRAKKVGFGWVVYAPVSAKAARELQHPSGCPTSRRFLASARRPTT